jgi:hypothetical protein
MQCISCTNRLSVCPEQFARLNRNCGPTHHWGFSFGSKTGCLCSTFSPHAALPFYYLAAHAPTSRCHGRFSDPEEPSCQPISRISVTQLINVTACNQHGARFLSSSSFLVALASAPPESLSLLSTAVARLSRLPTMGMTSRLLREA